MKTLSENLERKFGVKRRKEEVTRKELINMRIMKFDERKEKLKIDEWNKKK